ncbi:MAG: gephyrin-like molybdotransferase Glp [Candidatus Neomarinimicrobiota bacterium]|nr:gephyrin-like molybdotransferase Glp [Candidatus Neomarinimicrobiota bacterium]
MISVKEAKSIIQEKIFHLESEVVPLEKSNGRILHEDIIAKFSSPRFNNSAMDGFAVRSSDTIGASKQTPISLKNIGISSAGVPSDLVINKGECIQCMTGAKIPSGSDAVIMVEDTDGFSDNDNVQVMIEAQPGKHIRVKGEEINKGDILIPNRTPITASEIGICATFGYGELNVSKKPKIAIFGTGNELVEPGNNLNEGEIYNSNLYVFSDIVGNAGGEILMQDVLKDNKKYLKSFLSEALKSCDVVISSGGVSMGRFDYVRDVFIELGVEEHFWKVAQKPGKPLFFGSGNKTLIFGLPGNPVSSYIGFMVWVWPILNEMMGGNTLNPIQGELIESFPVENIKYRYLFGQAWIENGKILCKPSRKIGSHMLTSSLNANCILGAEPSDKKLNPGDLILVNLLPWKTIE